MVYKTYCLSDYNTDSGKMDLKFPVLSDEEASELEASKTSLENENKKTSAISRILYPAPKGAGCLLFICPYRCRYDVAAYPRHGRAALNCRYT